MRKKVIGISWPDKPTQLPAENTGKHEMLLSCWSYGVAAHCIQRAEAHHEYSGMVDSTYE
jgi:hypothetical protein